MAAKYVKQGVCKGCGAKILWGTTTYGKKMPLDIKQHSFFVETLENDFVEMKKGYIPHWATCPNALDFKKKRR